MKPSRTNVTVSKPRCGCCGKPGTDVAVIHAPAVLAGEVLADVAPGERRGGTQAVVAARVEVDVVDANEERIFRLPRERERRDADDRIALIAHGSTPNVCIKNA